MRIIKEAKFNEIKDVHTKCIPQALARRVPKVYQLAFLAANAAMEGQEKAEAVICLSPLGCLNETFSFLDKLADSDLGSPKDFVFSTHNSLGAMLAKEFGIKGTNFSLCDRSLDSALEIAEILDEKTVLIVEFDDANEFAKGVLQECNNVSRAFANAYLCVK